MVLTGAPCAGKTSALGFIEALFKDQGFHVVKAARLAELQGALLLSQLQAEDTAIAATRFTSQPSIVLCDSGALSGAAYCTPEVWSEVLRSTGCQTTALSCHYNLVLRLGSVAEMGQGELYDFGPGSSNPERFHTAEQAREVAPLFERCYSLCPQLFVPAHATLHAKLSVDK
eukprot:SAG31_NODE_18669_length_627_cov_0.912879_2_plen_172_part_01